MTDFVNPSNSQTDLYISRNLKRDISESFDCYEELKYRPDRVDDFLSEVNASEYVSEPITETFSDYNDSLTDEIDSFTAPELVENLISDSEVTEIEADYNQGLFQVDTYKTSGMEDSWAFWTPYVDDSSGEIIGLARNPYTGSESTFSHSVQDPINPSVCSNRDIGEAVYMMARETVPEGPEVARTTQSGRKVDENYLTGQFDILEGQLGLISELEEAGEIKTDDYTPATGSGPRGGHLAGAVRDFLSLAKQGRVIDYTVSNENRENRVKIRDGGYKHITRNLSKLGFSSTEELINSRITPAWKDKN